jgi:hypothetical protein
MSLGLILKAMADDRVVAFDGISLEASTAAADAGDKAPPRLRR